MRTDKRRAPAIAPSPPALQGIGRSAAGAFEQGLALLGMTMRRKFPRRVLMTLRLLLIDAKA